MFRFRLADFPSSAVKYAIGPFISWLRRATKLYDPADEHAAEFRAQQMQAVLRLTPLAMSVQMACALVVPVTLWNDLPKHQLIVWAAAIGALAFVSIRAWWRSYRRPAPRTASERAISRVVLHAALLSSLWALLPAMARDLADPEARYLIGILVTGMVCAGGFALAVVPIAGTVFVAIVGVGAAAELSRRGGPLALPLTLQLIGYAAIVIYTVWATARMMLARMVAEARASRQSEVISLLLRDFEDRSSDLLWELDENFRFSHISTRFADALKLSAEQRHVVNSLSVMEPLIPNDDEAQAAWTALRIALDQRSAFRDRIFITQSEDDRRWWSLSARPLTDSEGKWRGWRGVASDVSERQRALRRLNWLAHNDNLTGLVNRTKLLAVLQSLLPDMIANQHSLALVLLDLDGFKQINDSRGHAVGDQVLQVFGQRLLQNSRRGDTVARLGGDEFAILVLGPRDEADLEPFLERLLHSLAQPCDVAGQSCSLKASIGISRAPLDGNDADTLVSNADTAMYAAKHAGGHQYCFFSPAMADAGKRSTALTHALRGALERGELNLVYQPQIRTGDWKVCGFEALLRWRHPEFGEVSPAEFIPLAEAANLMPSIGDWVLTQACKQAATWPGSPRISVNVSATQLDRPSFVGRTAEEAARLAPGQLELEITESTLIVDPESALSVLRGLSRSGIHTALDDFGTGYSALGYLRRFPFDTLKIDRSFIRDLAQDGEAQILVDAILALAQALGMATVAEGVESFGEAELLRSKGCTVLQGFLISRPLPPDKINAFLGEWRGLS